MQNAFGLSRQSLWNSPGRKNLIAIQKYIAQINLIKKDPSIQQTKTRLGAHSSLENQQNSKLLQTNKRQTNICILQKQRVKVKTVNSQILMKIDDSSLDSKNKTCIRSGFKVNQVPVSTKTIYGSDRNLMRSSQNFSFNKKRTKLSVVSKYSVPKQRITTEQAQSIFDEFESRDMRNSLFGARGQSRNQSLSINNQSNQTNKQRIFQEKKKKQHQIQQLKAQILRKIHLYVRQLDQKGEQQLNVMLLRNFKNKIQSHNDAVVYEGKIRQMIKTNKFIVKILKEQLLYETQPPKKTIATEDDWFNIQTIQPKELFSLQKQRQMISEQKIQYRPAQQEPKQLLEQFGRKLQTIKIESSAQKTCRIQVSAKAEESQLVDLQISQKVDIQTQNATINKKEQVKQQPHARRCYQKQQEHVTSQFINEWSKSQIHKKLVYQKFRTSIYERFPQVKERQNMRRFKEKSTIDPVLPASEKADHLRQLNQTHHQKLPKQKPLKQVSCSKDKTLYSNLNVKVNSNCDLNLQSKKQIQNSNEELSNILNKSQFGQGNNASQKSLLLRKNQSNHSKLTSSRLNTSFISRHNSLSRKGSQVMEIMTTEDKQEAAKINFSNLIDFIFKRAFFYSISRQQVIQNKKQYDEIKYVPAVEQKNINISFLRYNAKSAQKKYLRNQRLKTDNCSGKGKFLIKNKLQIMNIQKQGRKQFYFLTKCLDDAVEDFLKSSKPR